MRRICAAVMVLLMALSCLTAQADKARGIENTKETAFHASHLMRHLNGVNCRVTGNYIKVRAAAKSNAKVVGHLEQADEFTLLEVSGDFAKIRVLKSHETSPDSWAGLEGWAMAVYVDCTCSEADYRANRDPDGRLTGGYFPYGMPAQWYFCSGAGAWSTKLTVLEDGSFSGYYHNWDAYVEDEDAYPRGSLEECSFSGRFSVPERISSYEYLVRVVEVTQEGKPGDSFARDGMLVTISPPSGIGTGDVFVIYLPGAELNRIPPLYHEWAVVANDKWNTRAYALYNMTGGYGWNEGE